ncbi:hypothetical protein KUTeg_000943 [Tegillarca granosa]|uniref:CUB domain-containing protein n=1 Tax=Tegillarca granosa TaxID=220873 RepID=A0ABQ9FW78_TEGGR|nr:hypothetical protein KUTeg_000943 [Tegillarca granosa]
MEHMCIGIILVFGVFVLSVQSLRYHCDPGQTTVITRQTSGTIQTVESSKTFYGNNLECSWIIDGGPNTRIQLNVTGVDLQWAPTYTLCTDYDNLQIRDGNTSSAKSLIAICGSINPYEVVSSRQYIHMTFRSNEKNFYDHTGVTLNFKVFCKQATGRECPEGWRELNDNCYKIETRTQADWNKAQTLCGYSQSNLVTIETDRVFDFIQDFGKRIQLQSAWIGLNDVATENTKLVFRLIRIVWLMILIEDYGFPNIVQEIKCPLFASVIKCDHYIIVHVLINFHEWIGNTEIYMLPEEKVEKGKQKEQKTSSTSIALAVILGILVGIVVIIGVIMWYCFCILKRHERQPSQSYTTESENLSPISQRQEAAPRRNRASRNVPPPTYNEAVSNDVIKKVFTHNRFHTSPVLSLHINFIPKTIMMKVTYVFLEKDVLASRKRIDV